MACSTCSRPIQSKYTASGYAPSAKIQTLQPSGIQFAVDYGAQTPPPPTVTAWLHRIVVAVIIQKAINQSKLTELKQSGRVHCSAYAHTRFRVHTRVYLQSPLSHMRLTTCGRLFVSDCCIILLRVCTTLSRFLYICQEVHMQGSETGRMQHSLRSLQCQAIPTGCEHLVNRLRSLSRPCILPLIFVSRLLSLPLW